MIQSDLFAKRVKRREEELRGKRSSEESMWQLLSNYCVPRKSSFTEKTSYGNTRDRQLLDSTAPRCVELLASFLHSSCNNPSATWVDMIIPGLENAAETGEFIPEEYAQYMTDVRDEMMLRMTTGSSDIYSALHEAYLDLAVFGTAIIYSEMDPNDLTSLRIFNYHLGDVVLDEGENGLINFAIRKFTFNKRQAQERWPDRLLGASIDGQPGSNEDEQATKEVCFLHACFPASDKDLIRLIPPEKMPEKKWAYYSAYVNATDGVTVSIGGYNSFPFSCPRWYKSGQRSVYGRSPSMTVLGDVLMVNRMAETVLRGAEKLVDPPLLVPDGGLISPVRLHPGGLTYAEPGVELKPLIPPGASRIELGEALIKERQAAIREGFFVPLFISAESPVQTATAVLQHADERNKATAPMVLRLQRELFDTLLPRVFELLDGYNLLPEPPDGVVNVRPKYRSPINASVRMTEALAVQRVFEGLAAWAQVDDGIFDRLDLDKIPAIIVAGAGASPELLRTNGQVKQVRDAKTAQAQMQAQQQQILGAVEAGAKLQSSEASMIKAQNS